MILDQKTSTATDVIAEEADRTAVVGMKNICKDMFSSGRYRYWIVEHEDSIRRCKMGLIHKDWMAIHP